jgi:AcrR family transcriptional regulator
MDQPTSPPTMTRRERRRRETIEEILDLSLEVMKQEGVAGLNLTAVAKRLGVQPTALYKYFPSLVAVYDALFRRAMDAFCTLISDTMADSAPGMDAIRASVRAVSTWAADNPELAQLLIWRPIAGYKPPPEAIAPAGDVMARLTAALAEAGAAGEIDPEMAENRGAHVFGILLTGAVTLNYAAEYGTLWPTNDFIEFLPDLVDMVISGMSPQRQSASE